MRRRILFAKLGRFSYTNDEIEIQIRKNFPDHTIIPVDTKQYLASKRWMMLRGLLSEFATFGPGVFRNRGDAHAFLLRTGYMFQSLTQEIREGYASQAAEFDLTVQTQGLFNGSLPGVPAMIYTDYTYLNALSVLNPDPHMFRAKSFMALEASLYQQAGAIAVSGSHVERSLVDDYGCAPSQVKTVHIGTNVEIVPLAADPDRYNRKHVLFVGVEWERKGGPTLVDAFQRIAASHPDARLTIIGCSPNVSGPGIKLLGRVPRENMVTHFASASVFCTPSLVEPLGIAAVEASLYRLPVIATRIDGFRETVTDGETGILVPPGDAPAVAAALDRLFRAPAEAARMGQSGFDRNHRRFNWDEVGSRLRSMAEQISPRLRARAISATSAKEESRVVLSSTPRTP